MIVLKYDSTTLIVLRSDPQLTHNVPGRPHILGVPVKGVARRPVGVTLMVFTGQNNIPEIDKSLLYNHWELTSIMIHFVS